MHAHGVEEVERRVARRFRRVEQPEREWEETTEMRWKVGEDL